MEDSLQATLKFLKGVADRFGYVLNPDDRALSRIASYMDHNKRSFGRFFCPCKQHYPLRPETDPICPCDAYQEEIATNGHCECHLFFEKGAAAQAKRRPGLLATVTCPG